MTAIIFFSDLFGRSQNLAQRANSLTLGSSVSTATCSGPKGLPEFCRNAGASEFGSYSMRRHRFFVSNRSDSRDRQSLLSLRNISPLVSAIAFWGIFLRGVILPIGKALWQVFTSPRFAAQPYPRAYYDKQSDAVLVDRLVFGSRPHSIRRTEGVVWLPERANVRAGNRLVFVRRPPGRTRTRRVARRAV